MASILKAARALFQRKPWPPLQFPTTGFKVSTDEYILEEERLSHYNKNLYYPVNIGQVFASRYQVVGKLGYEVSSTAWLACDLPNCIYATLKIYTQERDWSGKSKIYKALSKNNIKHQGRSNVRTALDTFTIPQEGGDHWCLVQKPVADSLDDFRNCGVGGRFAPKLLRLTLLYIFNALDYLHFECKIVHTNIKLDNIFRGDLRRQHLR